MPMECSCGGQLEPRTGGKFNFSWLLCTSCAGTWVQPLELERIWVNGPGGAFPSFVTAEPLREQDCPFCLGSLVHGRLASIKVARCKKDGFWFERRALAALVTPPSTKPLPAKAAPLAAIRFDHTCPCGGVLEPRRAGKFAFKWTQCATCAGTWVSPLELERMWANGPGGQVPRFVPPPPAPAPAPYRGVVTPPAPPRQCPDCAGPLTQGRFGDVTVQRCQGHGLWMPRGTLHKLVGAALKAN